MKLEGHYPEALRILMCLYSGNYCMMLYIFNIRYIKRNPDSLSVAKLAVVWIIY